MFIQQIPGLLLFLFVNKIDNHGMMLEPPNRSSEWRFDPTAPKNYDDNGIFCGGQYVQWNTYNGKCGVCGDSYGDPHPQANENTGKYGIGKVVRTYASGSIIYLQILLTANHLGYFNFSLCVLKNPNAPEPGEHCFQPLVLENGESRYNVSSNERIVDIHVKLPNGLICDRCVLRWHYYTGSNWGKCDDGIYRKGCGPQETFRNCADIAVK